MLAQTLISFAHIAEAMCVFSASAARALYLNQLQSQICNQLNTVYNF